MAGEFWAWRPESVSHGICWSPLSARYGEARLLVETTEEQLIPARDLRRIGVGEILAAVRTSAGDVQSTHPTQWNATVQAVAEHVDAAVSEAVNSRSLADLVDEDAAQAHAKSPSRKPLVAGDRQTLDENRSTADRPANIDVGTDRLDTQKQILQVARDRDLVDRVHDLTVLNPEACCAA